MWIVNLTASICNHVPIVNFMNSRFTKAEDLQYMHLHPLQKKIDRLNIDVRSTNNSSCKKYCCEIFHICF